MKARLFVIPGSHPAWTARLMLERKGIAYKRVDLVVVLSKAIVRAAGFPRKTVPALILDGERIQGSIEIGRALDAAVPDPPLFPSDPAARAAVEEAERWGDEVLQPIARRMVWKALKRDRSGIRSYLEGARLGLPTTVAAATAAPLVALSARFNEATDENVQRDLSEFGAILDHIDQLIADGVIGGAEPNAADFQIAPSISLALSLDDLKPAIEARPCGQLARRLLPDFPGRAPASLPAEWLAPLSAS